MLEQTTSERVDQEPTSSGLLLSVEPLQEEMLYSAAHTDDTDKDSEDAFPGDEEDASDDQEDATDADGSDDSDDSDD